MHTNSLFPPKRANGGKKTRSFSFRTDAELGEFVDSLTAKGYSVTDVMNQVLPFIRDMMEEIERFAPLLQHESRLRTSSLGQAVGQLAAERMKEKYRDFASTLQPLENERTADE